MYRIVRKSRGKLSYGSLITKIFNHLHIEIPNDLYKTSIPKVSVGEEMLLKMHFRSSKKGWTKVLKVGMNEDKLSRELLALAIKNREDEKRRSEKRKGPSSKFVPSPKKKQIKSFLKRIRDESKEDKEQIIVESDKGEESDMKKNRETEKWKKREKKKASRRKASRDGKQAESQAEIAKHREKTERKEEEERMKM